MYIISSNAKPKPNPKPSPPEDGFQASGYPPIGEEDALGFCFPSCVGAVYFWLRVWGLGFRVWGLGFRVLGFGFRGGRPCVVFPERVWGFGFRVRGLGFRV